MNTHKHLDEKTRLWIETSIDEILENKEKYEKSTRIALRAQGIQPNLETVLSFITGTACGLIFGYYRVKYNRDPSENETIELLQILKRRSSELREAFVSTRIEED